MQLLTLNYLEFFLATADTNWPWKEFSFSSDNRIIFLPDTRSTI